MPSLPYPRDKTASRTPGPNGSPTSANAVTGPDPRGTIATGASHLQPPPARRMRNPTSRSSQAPDSTYFPIYALIDWLHVLTLRASASERSTTSQPNTSVIHNLKQTTSSSPFSLLNPSSQFVHNPSTDQDRSVSGIARDQCPHATSNQATCVVQQCAVHVQLRILLPTRGRFYHEKNFAR